MRAPFRNYNKSKELLDDHEKRAFHKTSMERASCTQSQQTNTESRIDVSINQISVENFKQNKALLPSIVDAIMFCARQQIAFRGHMDDKINFDEAPVCNEGNFVAIIRMLAECNSSLKKHLISGFRNARYVSKTIQNEIIAVYANLIREHFLQCLQKCPHFASMADETASHGREFLSVCIRLLDFISDPSMKPQKRKVLMAVTDLDRITGEAIALTVQKSLNELKINLADCRGQAYDTTRSMSSDKKGVQAHIQKIALDVEYQGCCLHSLNLVICHACKIVSIRNMMDSCKELFAIFDNSPKRKKFLDKVIDSLSAETKKSIS